MTARIAPSGENDSGMSERPTTSSVASRRSAPSGRIDHTDADSSRLASDSVSASGRPAGRRAKKIRRPSGDHTGWKLRPSAVSRRSEDPSVRTT